MTSSHGTPEPDVSGPAAETPKTMADDDWDCTTSSRNSASRRGQKVTQVLVHPTPRSSVDPWDVSARSPLSTASVNSASSFRRILRSSARPPSIDPVVEKREDVKTLEVKETQTSERNLSARRGRRWTSSGATSAPPLWRATHYQKTF